MSNLVLFTVIDIVLLIAGLAIYLWIVGGQLTRIATNLEECNDLVLKIGGNAASIEGNLEHVNRTGGVVAGALPLLYGMAEKIVVGATYDPETVPERGPAVPASGRRRSRLHDAIGYMPDGPGSRAHAPLGRYVRAFVGRRIPSASSCRDGPGPTRPISFPSGSPDRCSGNPFVSGRPRPMTRDLKKESRQRSTTGGH